SGGQGASGGLVDIMGRSSVLFGSSVATTSGVTGISVSGDAAGGRLILASAGSIRSSSVLSCTVVSAASLNGAGGDIMITSAGEDLASHVSIALGGIDISGQSGG